MQRLLTVTCWLLAGGLAGAATLREEFSSDPSERGWQIFGSQSLFAWNSASQTLDVTWDSSQANSYFWHPLGITLNKHDEFRLEFDLQLHSVSAGVSSGKPFAFELAIGLLNYEKATNSNFIRGTGTASPNLVEFDYFPDTGFGATVSPVIVSSNNQFMPSFTFPMELTLGDWFHVAMDYNASNQVLTTTMIRNGQVFGTIQDVKLGPDFTDFRVDAVSVSSYSDAGADGSILAKGQIDNLAVTVADLPSHVLVGFFANGAWQVEFNGQTDWLYVLERTADFISWVEVSPVVAGAGGLQMLQDTSPPPDKAFYRVRAQRL